MAILIDSLRYQTRTSRVNNKFVFKGHLLGNCSLKRQLKNLQNKIGLRDNGSHNAYDLLNVTCRLVQRKLIVANKLQAFIAIRVRTVADRNKNKNRSANEEKRRKKLVANMRVVTQIKDCCHFQTAASLVLKRSFFFFVQLLIKLQFILLNAMQRNVSSTCLKVRLYGFKV